MRIFILVLAALSAPLFNSGALALESAAEILAAYHPVPAPAATGLLLKPGDRLAICGDSITEQKRYSRILEDYLTVCLPELRVTVRQFGWGGERADGFLKRMTNDVLRFQPTVATTCYGMNDHEYRPYEDSIGEAYRRNSTAVVECFKSHGVRVIQGSPGCVGSRSWWQKGATTEALNQNLCNLRNVGIDIAARENIAFADVFWPMLEASVVAVNRYGTNYAVAGGDGVHPNWAGHVIMAYAFLKALGVSGNLADFTVDLAANRAKLSTGHKLLSSHDGTFTIRSERYPFCPDAPMGLAADWYPTAGTYSPTNSDNLLSGMTLVPFNQELNRFMLTAKHATATQYRVTWGDQSREFTADQLAQGINLAEAFPQNPFSAKFAMVDDAVAAKQDFETRQIKTWFRPGGKLDAPMDQVAARTDQVLADTELQHAALAKVIRAAFTPVTYTLAITPE